MAKYKFDGTSLTEINKTIANVRGNEIREGSCSKTIGNIHGDEIREGSTSHTIFNVHGEEIRQGSGSKVIGSMDDVNKAIDGPGNVVKAALWVLCCR